MRNIVLLLLVIFLSSCGGSGGGSATPSVFTLSGTITTAAGTITDSDVNDPTVPPVSNNTLATAQPISNPVIVGGFASSVGSGVSGSNFALTGDTDDYYKITLTAGQVITLSISGTADLDLYLNDVNDNAIAYSTGVSAKETVTVPGSITQPTTLYIRVHAYASTPGASNYNLTVSQAGITGAGANAHQEAEFVPGEIIVRFKDINTAAAKGLNTLSARAQSIGMMALAGHSSRSMLMSIRNDPNLQQASATLKIPEVPTAASKALQLKLNTLLALKALKYRSDVQDAQLNYIYRAHAVPNDIYYPRQWHYPLISLPQAWDITQGQGNAIVAVIDTGILPQHPDFAGRLVPGYDFISDITNAGDGDGIDSDPTDPGNASVGGGYHGTHVAGTIAAAGNNYQNIGDAYAIGVTGVGWNLKVMPLRVLGNNGGTSYDLAQAIYYAARMTNDSQTVPATAADVINMSLGGLSSTDSTVLNAITAARSAGVIIVASAGNNASSELVYPASFDGVISVSAVDMNKTLAPYSSFGSRVDIAAPGGNMAVDQNGDGYPDGVLSTLGTGIGSSLSYTYGYYQGTSMAAPHVSGVIALMQSLYKSILPGQRITPGTFDLLLASGTITEDLGVTGRDDRYGFGMINAYKAIVQAQSLANGNPVPQIPILSVTPGSLNFGTSATSATLDLKNVGNSALVVSSVTENSTGWLTITRVSVDANGGETYQATVDRAGLADNIYTANITVVTNDRTVVIPVIMQVATNISNTNAGTQYVFLLNANTGAVVTYVTVFPTANGQYNYSFSNVDPGSYNILAGSDLNNNNLVCDQGESCGAYPILESSAAVPIVVSNDMSGLNFTTGFSATLINGASTAMLPSGKSPTVPLDNRKHPDPAYLGN